MRVRGEGAEAAAVVEAAMRRGAALWRAGSCEATADPHLKA